MFKISDRLAAVERRLDGMVKKITHLKRVDVPAELSAWETEDLHRHRPHMKRRRAGAMTLVRAHSWWEVKGRRRFARKLIRKGQDVSRWSTRPVLRQALFEKLRERVRGLAGKLKW